MKRPECYETKPTNESKTYSFMRIMKPLLDTVFTQW